MLLPGPAKKVCIYLNEDTIANKDYLSKEIMAILYERGVAGATVLRPAAGFGSHHRLHHRGSGIDEDPHMPVRIDFVETPERVNEILPLLEKLVVDGLIEMHDTTIVRAVIAEKSQTQPDRPAR